MIVAIKEESETARETDLYLADTALVDSKLRQQLETQDDIQLDDEVAQDMKVLAQAKPPALVERLVNVWTP